jgi:EAL and modified HD-GYP domain-containing signal transduction protein
MAIIWQRRPVTTLGTSAQETADSLVGRQPICGPTQKTVGYELLFREPQSASDVKPSPDKATAQVVVNSFMELGLDRVVGPALAFINVTPDFILTNKCRTLPNNRVVFEILEDTVPTPELMDALREHHDQGYRFALDDFNFGEQTRPFLPYCDYVKIDLRQVDRGSLKSQLATMNKTKLLAEKVETREEYDFCREAGFDYFQGYFFCKPEIIAGAKVPTSRLSLFRLMSKLRDPEVSTRDLEALVSSDVSLSYKLLRYINSATMGIRREIESVNHAVRMVGLKHIRMLASLIMMTGMEDKPRELTVVSLIRAKMCELLATQMAIPNRESYFTVGLFSTLDAFLDCTMGDALDHLSLSADIRGALLRNEGPLAAVLQSVLAYEQAQQITDHLKLDPNSIRRAYVDSICWSEDLMTGVAA